MWCHVGKATYNFAIEQLRSRKVTTECSVLINFLRDLGYEVDKCSNGNHYVYTKVSIEYYGGNFDCGHGRDPKVLPIYISKIIKVLIKHRDEEIEQTGQQEQ